jgi:hypothetical protein
MRTYLGIAVVNLLVFVSSIWAHAYRDHTTMSLEEIGQLEIGAAKNDGLVLAALEPIANQLPSSKWMKSFDTNASQSWFRSGQDADLLVSGAGFNNAGDGLSFNHPKGLITYGDKLLLADGNNNRILIWNRLPTSNSFPTLVLGQASFIANNPGSGLHQLNWPMSLSAGDDKLVVADTYNHRVLVWNSFPTYSGQPADVVLQGFDATTRLPLSPEKEHFAWPWGVWTNGEKLVISSTSKWTGDGRIGFGGWILIWEQFPTQNNQPADLILDAGGDFGTPRSITSNGFYLMVGDHNARNQTTEHGSFIWEMFPTQDNQPYDLFLSDPAGGYWSRGTFTDSGDLLISNGGNSIYLWNASRLPDSTGNRTPDLTVSNHHTGPRGGDGSTVAYGSGRVFVSDSNGNRILVYNQIPTRSDQAPDFAIGAPDLNTNTLLTRHLISNAAPVSDGNVMFVGDGYNRRVYGWQKVPTLIGASPSIVIEDDSVMSIALHDQTLVTQTARQGVRVWDGLPFSGEGPDVVLSNYIGTVALNDIKGIALDSSYFYLASEQTVYVFSGIPKGDEQPVARLSVSGQKLYSDDNHLSISTRNGVVVYAVADIANGGPPQTIGIGNYASESLGQSIVHDGHLFVLDHGFHRVYAWENFNDAISGQAPDALLGASDLTDKGPNIGKDGLFWPKTLSFDGKTLWVGEYKFSNRVVGFSLH